MKLFIKKNVCFLRVVAQSAVAVSLFWLFIAASASAFAQFEEIDESNEADEQLEANLEEAAPDTEHDSASELVLEDLVESDKADDSSDTAKPSAAESSHEAELKAYKQAFERYAHEHEEYLQTIDAIVEAEYNRKLTQINQSYDSKLRSLEAVERARRDEAIEVFERFVENYPRDSRATPDALFRLAELHFEKANDDFMLADEEYQIQRELYDMGRVADPPEYIARNYENSIAYFRQLVEQWPNYRQIDGAYYLLAYCELQMGNAETARDLLATLINTRPDSVFVPEAWLRIGEYHFDYIGGQGPDDLRSNLAIAKHAYEQVLSFGRSGFYDKALYKLAWTYYRMDDFGEAIEHFKQLVEYSDEEERRTGRSGAVLREEAVQYIAISLAEEDWVLDGVRDNDFGLPRVKRFLKGEHSYEREVLVQLSDYLFDRSLYSETLDILNYILESYPLHRDNPSIHEQIIVVLHRDGQRDEAFAVRRNLASIYGPGAEWYIHQKRLNAEDAVRRADNFVKENLIQTATWYHEEAQNLRGQALAMRDVELLEKTEERYAMAASAYEEFLSRYPTDREVFQWNFFLAECLYYSAQYMRAFEQYQAVRELDIPDNEYQEISAFNAIKALEFTMEEMVRNGQLDATALGGLNIDQAREAAQGLENKREVPDDERGRQLVVIESQTIPEMVEKYVTAMDRYVVLRLENEEDSYLDAKFAFQAAKVFYDYKDYEEARRRFAWIVRAYPEHEVGYLAGSLILESYRDENNFAKLAEWADILGDVIQGDQAEAVRAEVREFRLGGLFLTAEKYFDEKKYEEAAAEYIRLVDEAPEHRYAPRALNNAAIANEVIRRFDSAMRLYERVYQEYPDDPLAGYALFRVAINSEQFFEFDRAIQHYMMFYELFKGQAPPELEAMGFDVEENRVEALKSAAVLLENLQRYEEAANTYIQFAQTYPNDEHAGDGLWQAVRVWERSANPRRMIDTIQMYIRQYGQTAEQSSRVLEGMMMIAEHYESSGDRVASARWYRDILEEYQRRNLEPASAEAYYAAQAEFMLAEHQFGEWEKLKIDGNLRRQQQLLQEKIAGQRKLIELYNSVMGYRSLEWTMAANFRIGSLFQNFANALYEVPIPFEEGSEHYEMYQIQLEDIAIPLEDQAIERYEATIRRARQDLIVNEWTKKTLEQLNMYKPADYPLFKEERRGFQVKPVVGVPLLDQTSYETLRERIDPGDDRGPHVGQDADEDTVDELHDNADSGADSENANVDEDVVESVDEAVVESIDEEVVESIDEDVVESIDEEEDTW